jgi:TolB-like protein/DNA-binding winged helix-turn-helix (wHTH) protein/Flp pilus assembly protein TadD
LLRGRSLRKRKKKRDLQISVDEGNKKTQEASRMKLFKEFRLDTTNHILWRNGERVPVAPKGFDVLAYLVEHTGRVVTQDEILDAVWSETHVNPEVLRKYILEIRKILGDRHDKPEFIETVPKRGYRFVADVTDENVAEPASLASPHDADAQATETGVRSETPGSDQEVPSGKGALWKVVIVPLLALVAAVGIGGFRFAHSGAKPSSLSDPSIAVLPFADMSPTKDQEYFSDGLSEQLIHDLAKVAGLKVVARSSAFQFKGRNEDVREVGRKLGVAHVLEGSVRRDGNHIRITAELIKTDDGFQLWSQTYDRQTKDILAVQDDIALATTEVLRLKLLGANGQRLTSNLRSANPEAYQAYLEGQYFIARGDDKPDLEKALSYAEQAVKLDASYAPGWAQQALVLETMASYSLIENSYGYRRARESAEKSIALDPNLAEGYMVMGLIQTDHDWDWESADETFRRAGLLEPGSGEVLANRAYLARSLGNLDDAVRLHREAIALDPLSADFHLLLGYELYFMGRSEEALAELQRAQELNPRISALHLTRGKILFSNGHPQEALNEIEKETGEWEKLSGEALAYYVVGRSEEADKALKKLITTHQGDAAYQIAEVYAFRGEIDKAFEWLDRAYRQRDPGLPELKTGPLMRSLRQDPRYTELLKKLRLPM